VGCPACADGRDTVRAARTGVKAAVAAFPAFGYKPEPRRGGSVGSFASFFRSPTPARDKYLSRLFGLFSEEVVRTWSACPQAPYADLGRPTVCRPGETRGHTLDFTFRRRESGRDYAAELKCELEYDGYRYLTLTNSDQVRHHTSVAFAKLLGLARNPQSFIVRRQGRVEPVDGAILVWGSLTEDGRRMTMEEYGFADVLSVEAMVFDLQAWSPTAWRELINRYRGWTLELFDFLAGPVTREAPATARGI
jgi:hypothetical protein